MHRPALHQRPTANDPIWLFAGTADGPPLAAALLAVGWRVHVRLVSRAATRSYAPHPRLQLEVGALASDQLLVEEMERLQPRWVVDATHPFAQEIRQRLQRTCQSRCQPLLRLDRREPEKASAGEQLLWLDNVAELIQVPLQDKRLLLAIGARQLAAARQASEGSSHFARVLDQPASLQAALAAGLAEDRIACLRPDSSGKGDLEAALCRRWRISHVLCRQGGGRSEALWRRVCRELNLPLLLLRRPHEPSGLSPEKLLENLGKP